ncbi:hypothetical protein OIU78_028438 [Salix suchowensis]|uniref:Uncharacterized protein n=1 Tax=Salix koriyanagi TaxID=2511006 RepID=A0A9Q0ZGG5_9ROSI|nr:hypothetical protein OIU78_028438 [Salix suchowensis]KAJ6733512.1 hypothetical protein OIU74_005311 [Salix koriyanagi]
MSDIAILVAEENERRVKNSRKAAGGEGGVEINWVSRASVMAKSIKDKIGKEKTELLRLVLEPKSQVSLAASDGFFSA